MRKIALGLFFCIKFYQKCNMIADCLELLFYKSHLQSHDPDVAAIIFGFSVSELSQLRDYLKDGRHSFMHFFTDILS